MSPEPVNPWPHAEDCVPQMCTEWTEPPPCSITEHASCTEMPAGRGTFGNPPSGGALTAQPRSPIAEALTPTVTTHSASTAATPIAGSHAPAEAALVGGGVLVTVVVVAALALGWRKRQVTSPTVPAGTEEAPHA